MTDWPTFAGLVGVILLVVLVLAHASRGLIEEIGDDERPPHDGATSIDDGDGDGPSEGTSDRSTTQSRAQPSARDQRISNITTGELLANVALSHGLFGVILVLGVWYTQVPPRTLGVEATPVSVGLPAVAIGLGLGVVLYLANEVGAAVGQRFGIGHSEALREALAPESTRGWILLLGVVLPIVAAFEELLFRAALIGALSVGFGVSPWVLAVASSIAFAFGHGAQGPGGIVVTGVLGFALALAFVVTGSLLAVIVAHYVVNALEFLIHEGLEVEWAQHG